MTREFYKKLKEEFPEHSDWDKGFFISNGGPGIGYEQFGVVKKGPGFKEPTIEEVEKISLDTLVDIRRISIAKNDYLQGIGKGDIVIIPGNQTIGQQHFIGIWMGHSEGKKVFFSTSWHGSYGMTEQQIERYISFAKTYFSKFSNH